MLMTRLNSGRSDFDTEPLYIDVGEIYFGGLPAGFRTPKNVVASRESFVGCISDVMIGRSVVNFANYTDRKNAHLDNCGSDVFGMNAIDAAVYIKSLQ